tara:strand:+ start:997 stop:1200 length:204 start_codon:yes stop_codon:yes gene_type:complete
MEVGDLVTLSSAGWFNKGNVAVREKVGVIIEVTEWGKYPYNIRWFNVSSLCPFKGQLSMKRYEIKKA